MRHRWLWTTLGALVVVLGIATGGLYAYDATRSDVVAHGVTAGGVDVGGMTAQAARARLRRDLVPRVERAVTLTYGNRSFVLTPRQAGLAVDVRGMVDEAVAESRRGNFFSRAFRDVRGRDLHVSVPLRTEYSSAAVDAFVRRVRNAVHRPAQDASVVASATSLDVVRAHSGLDVRRRLLRQLVARELTDPDASRTSAVPTRRVQPRVNAWDLRERYPAYILICRSCFQLRLYVHLKLWRVYRIAVGRQGLETPAGLYEIDDKQVNPSWHVPNSAWAGDLAGRVIPPGPDDPIKARWLGFYNGAGIHGTDDVWSLGTAASHGCIRMSIPDVIELYDLVPLHSPIYVG
jgi:hypothetical protein